MTAQLVSLVDVLGAAAKEPGQHKSQDLSASLAAQAATSRILSLLGSETFDRGSYEDTFYVDEESGRASDVLTFKLSNGFVDSGQPVTVKTSAEMDQSFSETSAPFKVLWEKGWVRMAWNPRTLADVYVKISYTSGFTTSDTPHQYAGQPNLVETIYQDVPDWLEDVAIGRSMLQMVVSGAIQRGKDKAERAPIDRLMALDDEVLAQKNRYASAAFKPIF